MKIENLIKLAQQFVETRENFYPSEEHYISTIYDIVDNDEIFIEIGSKNIEFDSSCLVFNKKTQFMSIISFVEMVDALGNANMNNKKIEKYIIQE